ncbi:thioesterase domain-containing protein [Streptomyces anthocyanicus]|uniref:thioesterase domain-containing protein n=1 Tax=Streptomyces anthocyanicus TaxID=68174 RepID=UPI003867D12E
MSTRWLDSAGPTRRSRATFPPRYPSTDLRPAASTIQPDGRPYHLLGWSLGGVVAQEIAVQLQGAGSRAAFLVLLGSFPSQETELGNQGAGGDRAADPTGPVPDASSRTPRETVSGWRTWTTASGPRRCN